MFKKFLFLAISLLMVISAFSEELQASFFRNAARAPLEKFNSLIKNEKNRESRNELIRKRNGCCLLNAAAVLMPAIKNNQECYALIVSTYDPRINHVIPIVFSDKKYRYYDAKIITNLNEIKIDYRYSNELRLDRKWINYNFDPSYKEAEKIFNGKSFFTEYKNNMVLRFPTVVHYMEIERFYLEYINGDE